MSNKQVKVVELIISEYRFLACGIKSEGMKPAIFIYSLADYSSGIANVLLHQGRGYGVDIYRAQNLFACCNFY